MKPIEWRRAGSGQRGSIDGIHLFTIACGLLPDRSRPWELSTTLPGFDQKIPHESIEAAQKTARWVLLRFAERIGASDSGASPPAVEKDPR